MKGPNNSRAELAARSYKGLIIEKVKKSRKNL
jgi:hypothetical protein